MAGISITACILSLFVVEIIVLSLQLVCRIHTVRCRVGSVWDRVWQCSYETKHKRKQGCQIGMQFISVLMSYVSARPGYLFSQSQKVRLLGSHKVPRFDK
jgi:hypothetical protein